MNARRTLNSSAALALGTLAVWLYLLFGQGGGLEVVNQTPGLLSGVTVCAPSGACLHRERLWPHQSWRVPLEVAGGERVALRVNRAGQAENLKASGPGSRFVVTGNGQVVIE